jgi:ACGX-repeat protein
MKTLSKLNGWANSGEYYSPRSAQGYLNQDAVKMTGTGCGSACGAKDDDSKPKPSACGAGDEEKKPQPSACGAGDEGTAPKPSACGSACGSDGK